MARSQKVIRIKKTAVVAAGLLVFLGGGMATAQSSSAEQDHQSSTVTTPEGDQSWSWVCKYVGKPGEAERLKPGKQPIHVATSATEGNWFNDEQGRSFVLERATEDNTDSHNKYTGHRSCQGTPTKTTTPPDDETTTHTTTPPDDETTTHTTTPPVTTTTTHTTTPPVTTTATVTTPPTETTTTTAAPGVVTTKAPNSVQVLGASETAKGVSKTAPAVAGAPKSLAFTGPAEVLPLGLVGLFALALGSVLTAVARRRVRS